MTGFIIFLASPSGAVVWPIGCLAAMIVTMIIIEL